MGHFATLKGIKADTRVTFTFHPETKKTKPSKFFYAVGRFMEEWVAYVDDWELKRGLNDYDDPIIRFVADLEDVPALQYGPEISMFMRGAENWERGKDFDRWCFTNYLEFEQELADYHFNDFAYWCGYSDPEKLGYDDTGFECEAACVYVSEMVGFVPIADNEPLSELEGARMKGKA